ncbi:MAG: agmatinase [Dehalococcoidia bacterium]
MTGKHYGPPDASRSPRFTGVRTFARCPHARVTEGVDLAVVGIPFDTATSNRPGSRFGPSAIRDQSIALRPFNPALKVDVFDALSVVDWGDLDTTPGNAERTAGQIDAQLRPLLEAGLVTIALGGDHSIVLGELRAHAATHGPLALVLLDAHADTWDGYYGERYFHGTSFRRAAEEGLLLPERSLMAGMRGSLYSSADWSDARSLGFDLMVDQELVSLTPGEFASAVRKRVGDAPVFMSFDIDVVDPAFAPGTGTPEVGGLTSREALRYVRALSGMEFKGFDVVEVSPPFDDAGATTAVLAASLAYEFMSLVAVARNAHG